MEHVIQIAGATHNTDPGASLKTELASGQVLYGGTGNSVRGTDPAIVSLSDSLATTKDLTSSTDKVIYHECRHDEGVGRCGAVLK